MYKYRYPDPPATARALEFALEDYVHAFGSVSKFPLDKMERMRMPLVAWRHVFSAARKRLELRKPIFDIVAWIMSAAHTEKATIWEEEVSI
jgi:hypothetical protein